MKILFTAPVLNYGGIEVLALRFSEAFSKIGHEVVLYDFRPDLRNEEMVSHFNTSNFKIVGMQPSAWRDWCNWKLNAILIKTGLLKNFRERLIEKHFGKFIKKNKFDIICSLAFDQDYVVCKYCYLNNTPVVISMHGTYEYTSPIWPERARVIYDRVSAIIYAADKNMSWYKKQDYYQLSKPAFRINTGADLTALIPRTTSRHDLGISQEAFVFIMVARGIEQKGWQQAIDAQILLIKEYSNVVLLLVGDSDYDQQLKRRYSDENSIVFYGVHPNSVELTQLSNVGLLPSYFEGETLPNVIIDYLRCQLPVISTNIGEIPNMLTLPDGQVAGEILTLLNPGVALAVDTLKAAMESYLADNTYYKSKIILANQAAGKFDIRQCVDNYLSVFEQVLNK